MSDPAREAVKDERQPGGETARVLDYAFARTHGVVQMEDGGPPFKVGLRPGADPLVLLETRRALGGALTVENLTATDFDAALAKRYAVSSEAARSLAQGFDADAALDALGDGPATADLLDSQDDAPVIRLINGLIAEAVSQGASDVHVEPYENTLIIRMRIDGQLREVMQAPARAKARVVSRIKVMARLDIAEKRLPQDGRISLTLGGRNIDVRVSTLPSRFGERVVMRLLDKDQGARSFESLGVPAPVRARLEAALAVPNGVLLVTGPTGSGKTTTLYAALTQLNDKTRNILTVEDPVEYAVEGVGQTQVNPKIGLTFAQGLRAILRQDPDVVMIGEIRDAETAQIAVQASLTGHLVLSTVHTNSAVAAITRLKDMGVEPYLLASTVRGVLAQRLVRRLCSACKAPAVLGPQERARFHAIGIDDPQAFEARGCPGCKGAGYTGRIGLYEFVVVDDDLRRMIHADATEDDLAAIAFRTSEPLTISGLRCAAEGITSLSDVLRALGPMAGGAGPG